MGPLSGGFEYPCETEPIRDLPTARLVVSAVNRSTLTRVSSRSEISASVLTSQGREITVDISRLLSPHTLRNRVVQSFSSSISLCIQVRFLSGYQLLDYASATSLRKNGPIYPKDGDGSIRHKSCDRQSIGTREEMVRCHEHFKHCLEGQGSRIGKLRGMAY